MNEFEKRCTALFANELNSLLANFNVATEPDLRRYEDAKNSCSDFGIFSISDFGENI